MNDRNGNKIKIGSLVKLSAVRQEASPIVATVVDLALDGNGKTAATIKWQDQTSASAFLWYSWELLLAEPEDLI